MNGTKCIAEVVIKKLNVNKRYPDNVTQPRLIIWCDIMETTTYVYDDNSYIINNHCTRLDWALNHNKLKTGPDFGHSGG